MCVIGSFIFDIVLLLGDFGLFGFDVVCWKVYVDFLVMMVGGISVLLL